MVACSFVAQGPLNDDEVGGRLDGADLTGGRHADEELATCGKELFGEKNRKGCADRASDDAVTSALMIELIQVSVVASPVAAAAGASGGREVAHNVAVRIKHADCWNCGLR
jgi:hypothetical protein